MSLFRQHSKAAVDGVSRPQHDSTADHYVTYDNKYEHIVAGIGL